MICLLMIILNAVWLAVETDYNDEPLLANADPPFVIAENLFCTFFVGELIIRFMAFKVKADTMKDRWFMFDAVLVFFMAFETWLLSLLVLMSAGSLTTSSSSTSVLRVVRLFRITRAARVARLLKSVPELMVIGRGVVIVARTVFVIMCLLLMIMYTFAIVFTQLAKGTHLEQTICSDMLTTMSTLLLGGILPDWKPTTDLISEEDFFFAFFFFTFVMFAYFTIMNMLRRRQAPEGEAHPPPAGTPLAEEPAPEQRRKRRRRRQCPEEEEDEEDEAAAASHAHTTSQPARA
jgi:hypothetical protein